ncbi:hypothetical protein DACRYDRAFT_75103 [Dacryopinax primogenitus]|uniref:Phytanoyl-CoA dioxygenase n=1 Tax=Dacryopinax primogenitus (strain DJM 731) TaxID=1858805 RepID=M5GAA3_DACPD|nr:uncharacterized protein DACRYDRAFT_75103 [Dacryopinax primogenitus]EJU05744.1 hypothetical protein DACRYDRAFT_75103 [Dacryopinax primogenitus]
MAPQEFKVLTPEMREFFMDNGYLIIPQALLPEYADEFTKDVWTRLGYNPDDKTTWAKDRIHMAWHHAEEARKMAPKAWAAICELLGGEDRVTETSAKWRDNIILNLGAAEWKEKFLQPKELDNWHIDGDFFRHYLDSPEQGMLVIPLFSDVLHNGGATYISPDGMELAARWLAEHPEGTMPASSGGFKFADLIPECKQFVEVTGKKGDVVLLHPLMLHSATKNHIQQPRFITNPPVAVKEPFNFNRENPEDYSLVELKTLRALGKDRFPFKITGTRDHVTAPRVPFQQAILEEELERLVAYAKEHDTKPNTVHLGPEGEYERTHLVPCGNQFLSTPSNLARLVSAQ